MYLRLERCNSRKIKNIVLMDDKMGTSGYQDLKSIDDCRVNIGRALNYGGSRWNLETSQDCGVGACGLTTDIYGRPVNSNTLYYGTNRPCAQYSPFPAARILSIESSLRPRPRVGCCAPVNCCNEDSDVNAYGMNSGALTDGAYLGQVPIPHPPYIPHHPGSRYPHHH